MYSMRAALGAVVLLGCAVSFGQSARAGLSIEEVVRIALGANREYLAAQEKVREAQALLRQAGMRPSPAIEVESATGALTGSRGESEFSAAYFHTLETGGKRDKRMAIAQLGVAIAEAEVQESRRTLVAEIKSRFIAAASGQLRVLSLRALAPVTDESYRLTLRRVELGDAAPLEQQLLLAESNRLQAQQTAGIAAGDAASLELKAAVGLPAPEPLDVAADLSFAMRSLDIRELREYALKERPDLKILRLLEQQAEAEGSLARAEASPNLTASARYTRSQSRFDQLGLSEAGAIVPLRDSDNLIAFGLSIPLFGRKRAATAEAVAQSQQSQQRLRREYLERAIPLEIEAAYRRWAGAGRTVDILRTGVIEPSQKNLIVIREAYRLGQLRLFDVLNEQRRIFELEASLIDAQAEAARAFVELERAVGGNLP